MGSRFAPLTDEGPGRRRVARPERQELHAAALDRPTGTVGTVGIDIALRVAVVGGVGVDQHAVRPALLGIAHLEPPKEFAVPRQDDLPFDVDPEAVERGEVLSRP